MSDNPEGNDPPPGKKRAQRVGRLHTVGHLVSEMGKVYRQARKGEVDSAIAMRFVQMLALMRQAKEATELEQRLRDLEEGEKPAPAPKPLAPAWVPLHQRQKVPA